MLMLLTCLPPYLTASALSQPWKNRNAAVEETCQNFKKVSKHKNKIYISFAQYPVIENFFGIHLDL